MHVAILCLGFVVRPGQVVHDVRQQQQQITSFLGNHLVQRNGGFVLVRKYNSALDL